MLESMPNSKRNYRPIPAACEAALLLRFPDYLQGILVVS